MCKLWYVGVFVNYSVIFWSSIVDKLDVGFEFVLKLSLIIWNSCGFNLFSIIYYFFSCVNC